MAAAIAEGAVPRRSCAACSEERKSDYGCESETERQEHWIRLGGENEPIKRCPYALVTAREMRVMQLCGLIESGVLPDAGGWLDQAATYTEAAGIALGARRDFARTKTNDGR